MWSTRAGAAGLGLGVGAFWGLAQYAVLSLSSGWVPPGAVAVETIASAVLWTVVSVALERLGRTWVRGRLRLHACVLMTLFFLVYGTWGVVYHLLTLEQWKSIALSVGAYGVPLLVVTAVAIRRASASARSGESPGLLVWLVAVGMMCGLLVWGAELSYRPPGVERIAMFLIPCFLAATVMLAVVAWKPGSGKPDRLGAAVVVLLLVVAPALQDTLAVEDATKAQSAADGPPVILISLDTTRADHLSAYGYARETSPRLAEFAEEARLFTRAYATSSWTLPSHASVFTGRLPVEHGAHYPEGARRGAKPQAMTPELRTMAEAFAERGYHTAAIAANRLAVAPEFGLDRGFEEVVAERRFSYEPFHLTFLYLVRRSIHHPAVQRFLIWYWPADRITDVAVSWVEKHRNEPFFLLVNYLDPHSPRVPRETLEPSYVEGSHSETDGSSPRNRDAVERYDAEIRFMDDHLGRFFDGLRRLGIFDRAVIVVFSDHGEFLGEHGLSGHGLNLDEPVQRAALIARYPGGRHAGVEPRVATIADVPALVEGAMQGLPPAEALDRSGPVVTGEKYLTAQEREERRWAGAEHLVAVHWNDLKLVAHPEGWRLFDLVRDPLEEQDVSTKHPEEARQMVDALERWREGARAPEMGVEADPDSVELLRALGYVE